MLGYIIAAVATLIVSIPVTILITVTYRKKVAEAVYKTPPAYMTLSQ